MKQIERFDAIGINEQLLGFDLIRDEPIAESVYHYVVAIYCFDRKGKILVTKRAPEKKYPLLWEVTSGSVLKGEKVIDGAIRELEEETGLKAKASDFHLISTIIKHPSIYKTFVVCLDFDPVDIRLQEGETIDFRLLDIAEFLRFQSSEDFVRTLSIRFESYRDDVLKFYDKICGREG